MKKIDLDTWYRKEQFNFFLDMDDPYTGVVVDVDCTRARRRAAELNTSFWLYYMHRSLAAAMSTEPFRYRIDGQGQVFCCEELWAGTTIDNPGGSFSFANLRYREDYDAFALESAAILEAVRSQPGINFNEESTRPEVIMYTTLPWLRFTALKHAASFGRGECRPRISFGQCAQVAGRWTMPVSVEAHHSLMDGRDIADHIALFQRLLDE